MNEKLNTLKNTLLKIAAASMPAAGTLITYLASNNPNLAATAGTALSAVGGLLMSNAAQQIPDAAKAVLANRKIRKKDPEKLNHDVVRVARYATIAALKDTEIFYKNHENYKEFAKLIDELCVELKKDNERWIEVDDQDTQIDTADIINYDRESDSDLKFNNLIEKELSEIDEVLNDKEFFVQFEKYFHIRFGECLKNPEYRPALIAYEREMQKMILSAVEELQENIKDVKINLDSQNINRIIKESIAKIPAVAANTEMQEEIKQELQELREYFKSKTLKIKALRGDKLIGEDSKEYPTNLAGFKEETKNYSYFEYNDFPQSIDDLGEEDFAYFTKDILVNHILIPNLLNAIKDSCINQDYEGIYERIKDQEDKYIKNDTLWSDCTTFIRQTFFGIITPYIDKLLSPKESQETEQIKSYIKECREIIKITIDLSVSVLLTCLLEENINLKKEDKDEILKYFKTESKKILVKIDFAHRLMTILAESNTEKQSVLLQELLKLKNDFSKNGYIYVLCDELEKLITYTLGDVNLFDNYRAEKIVTEFLEYFAFLCNYTIISTQGIEYHNMKKSLPKYIQHYYPTEISQEKKEATADTFTHAVYLQNRDNDEMLNLFPFVIDRNALNNNNTKTNIAFFNYHNTYVKDKCLVEYDILNFKPEESKENLGKLQKKEIDSKTNQYAKENIEQYNINCLLESFESIKKTLTE